MADFVESTKDASRGGYQGIKKVRGLLTELKKVPPRFTESDYGEPKEQIEFVLEDATILEMFQGRKNLNSKRAGLLVGLLMLCQARPHMLIQAT